MINAPTINLVNVHLPLDLIEGLFIGLITGMVLSFSSMMFSTAVSDWFDRKFRKVDS